jgi:hypothetical protein
MKQMLKKFFSLAALLSTVSAYSVIPYYSIRNQGQDVARDLAGMTQHENLFDMDKIYGTFAVTTEYSQTFRPNRIAEALFGPAVCNSSCDGATIAVSGSRVANRGANDWLADYFYLPTDFQSTLKFSPRIRNVVVDLDFYLGLDEWACGLYMRINAPIVWSQWNLNFCESVVSTGSLNYAPGYFNTYDVAPTTAVPSGVGIARSNLLTSASAFFSGSTITDTPATTTQVVTYDPLCYGKITGCARHKTALADLAVTLGYNFLNDEDYHLGVGIRMLAPTGTKPHAKYLFEPIVGNGHHWELGAEVSGHAMLWRSCDEESNLGFFVDANITHLFKAKQTRTADLNGLPLSRYMLAERLTTNSGTSLGGIAGATGTAAATAATAPTAPVSVFAGEFAPVANLTTRDVKVSVGVQGDVAAQFTYTRCGFAMDLGYNFWGRSKEKVSCSSNCSTGCSSSSNCATSCSSSVACTTTPFAPNTWALKGDAQVYSFNRTTGLAVPLSATESLATINAGTNVAQEGVPASNPGQLAIDKRNPNVDAPQFAYNGTTIGATVLDASFNNGTPAADAINTSIQPVFISQAAVTGVTNSGFNYATNRGISNKIYTNLSYNWVDCEDWVPYVGVGGFGEFGNGGKCGSSCSSSSAACSTTNSCSSSCSTGCSSTSEKAAISQWGVWAKLGVSFN